MLGNEVLSPSATNEKKGNKARHIKKVAVLGSGLMGTGIAAHCANIGLEVLMLDIVPFDLKEEEKNNPAARNRMADASLKAALKNKLNMHCLQTD